MIVLRPYQERTVEHIVAYAAENVRGRLLIVCPPGGGKTSIAAFTLRYLVAEQGLRGLAWAHRRELIGQLYSHLIECGIPSDMIGVLMANDSRENPAAPIQVTSIDTLRHRAKPPADVVVSDEAHRDASDGRRTLRAVYPDAFHLGFTATPMRMDGRSLGDEYESIYVAAQPSELIAAGHIVAPSIFTVPAEMLPDLRMARKRGGDFCENDLEKAANRTVLVGDIVDHWKRRAEGRRTIAFPVSVKHSLAIVSRFNESGVKATHLDGRTPTNERLRIIASLRSGDVSVVSSCGVLSEGVDAPEVKCVIMARPTVSLGLFIQQAGRCARPWNGIAPIILDHAGNAVTQKHRMPHADRNWSVGKGQRNGTGAPPVRTCASCFAVVDAGRRSCPTCNVAIPQAPERVIEASGELIEHAIRFTDDEKWFELKKIRDIANRRELSRDWVDAVYSARFGGPGSVETTE